MGLYVTGQDGLMWGWDPNPGPGGVEVLFPRSLSLAAWLGRWIEGTLYQPWLIEDPVTGTWRGVA